MEENEEQEVSVFKGAVKPGLIVGALGIILTLLAYVVKPTLLGSGMFGFAVMIIILVVMVVLGISYRKSGTGYMTFGQAFLFSFITFLISGILGIIFNILLYSVIDPDLSAVVIEATIENTRDTMESFGAPEGAIEDQLDQMAEDLPDNYTTAGQLKGFGILVLIYAFVSLITGLIIKKKEPEIEDF